MPTKIFDSQKPKLTYLSVTGKANCYIQRQSTPTRINVHLPVCAYIFSFTRILGFKILVGIYTVMYA